MRIVHVSESDLHGGASRCGYRIHRALVEAGVDSHFLVGEKASADPTVAELFPRRGAILRRRWRERLEELPLWRYRHRRPAIFSTNWAPNSAARAIAAARPDVVHLHWINHGLLPRGDLGRLGAPLVWSLWDEWPFTGGCHYTGPCDRFTQACGACPVLGSTAARDLSAAVLAAKHRAWRGLTLELVAANRQLAAKARTSALFRNVPCNVVPQAIDPRVFRPLPRAQARSLLGLDPDAAIIVMGGDALAEPRKGFDLAAAALATDILAPVGSTLLCLFGDPPPDLPVRLGSTPLRHLGRLRDELTVALLFSAADAALVPSREDTGPQVAVEALACGTPVVGFPVGVTADLVQHQRNGFLATPFDPAALATGLRWALEHRGDETIRAAARASVLEFCDVRTHVPRYLEIYRRLQAACHSP